MSITIYKDVSANAIYFGDANGAQFLNTLQATSDGSTCSVTDLAKDIELISDLAPSEFIDQNGDAWGVTGTEVCNALNAIFQDSGTPTTELPVITSTLTASIVEGETLNYELTADYGIAYEWDFSSVTGIATVEGNSRKIVGGSSLSSGTYSIPMKAINYNGEDSETLVLTVSTPPFANTKSVQFSNQDYLGANASLVDGILGRSSNGSGSSDAWSVSFFFKGSTDTNGQTILYFGDSDTTNGGHLYLRFVGSDDRLRLQYGTSSNYLRWNSASSLLSPSTWKHVLVTYDGGTTGAGSADVNDYYSRFRIFVDGGEVTSGGTWSNGNYGYTGGVDPDNFRVGRYASGNYMRGGCKVDELALWSGDQSSNITAIYNSGTPHDLSGLTDPPEHWWRMGDGDTYPSLLDSGTESNCTFVMYNMTSADIVSDVP